MSGDVVQENVAESFDGFLCQAVTFDFQTRRHQNVRLDQVSAAMQIGEFAWADFNVVDPGAVRRAVVDLKHVDQQAVAEATVGEKRGPYQRHGNSLHLVLIGCRRSARALQLQRLDVVLGDRCLLTFHRHPIDFLDAVRRDYAEDFVQHAISPSFLVYELFDHLLENYQEVQRQLEDEVELLRTQLAVSADERTFADVSDLMSELLRFRKLLSPLRSAMNELATRKSSLLSEETQSYLARMVDTLDHILADLLISCDILSQTLNLHLSMVAHRTNQVVRRLTAVSVIFLPLMFLCGVYGMNFVHLPEIQWTWGYPLFWLAAISIAGVQMWFLWKKRLL